MKKFLINVFLFLLPWPVVVIGIFLMEEGGSDPYYLRVATPRQKSLIIGTSRAAQGLIPTVIDQKLQSHYPHKIFNYSFTVNSSPFGKVYYESIAKKLEPTTSNGIFIVAVDPWSISDMGDDPNNEEQFGENDGFLARVTDVSTAPNFQYLLNFYSIPYYNIVLRKFRQRHLRLHPNGWLEVNVGMSERVVQDRIRLKMKVYKKYAKQYKFSATRLDYLGKTIKLLQQHGDVYLVRLPVHESMMTLENDFMKDFDQKIGVIIESYKLPYLDMTSMAANYRYTDGNHLYKASSMQVSQTIADWIVNEKHFAYKGR